LLSLLPAPGKAEDTEHNLMREVSRGGAIALGSGEAERIFALWERNLDAILRLWRDHGVPVLVSDISSNLMFPPFLFDTLALASPGLRALRHGGGRLPEDPESLAAQLQAARTGDTANAFIEYWTGRLAALHADSAAARQLLMHARDLDLLKFRAPGRINEILRNVCRRLDVPCVSTDSLFIAISPGGIPGDEVFREHLHPTAFGYYEIATLMARTILGMNLLHQRGETVFTPLPFDPDSLSICWLDRAYGDLSIRHLTGRWPFEHYSRAPDVLDAARPEQRAVAQAVYDRKITWDQGCYESAAQFWKRGDLRSAATTYEALLEEYPYNSYPRYLLGNLLGNMGRRTEAIGQLQRSVASNPTYPQARLDLGLLLINEGRFDEAVRGLMEALRLPAAQKNQRLLSGIHYGLGAAYANMRDATGAARELQEAVRLDSGNVDARNMLKRLNRTRGDS
jgi:tetratricopeptide (TPR) repeat protein